MSKFIVVCKLPNASELISGVRFEIGANGHAFSEPVDEAVAQHFASIEGYEVVQQPEKPAKGAKGAKGDPAAGAEGQGGEQGE